MKELGIPNRFTRLVRLTIQSSYSKEKVKAEPFATSIHHTIQDSLKRCNRKVA